MITKLLGQGHQLVTRAKSNAVAYWPVQVPARRRRGRPRFYGEKVRLKGFGRDQSQFIPLQAPSTASRMLRCAIAPSISCGGRRDGLYASS